VYDRNLTLLIMTCAWLVMPSSYGYVRCLEYLGYQNSSEAVYGLAGSNVNGSCAAMIWSGHTAGTILSLYYLFVALDLEFLRPYAATHRSDAAQMHLTCSCCAPAALLLRTSPDSASGWW
jgi:hypothetical protein